MNQSPSSLDVASVEGTIDVGILTIREDEFAAVLHHFPVNALALGRRQYNLSNLNGSGGLSRRIAVIRCTEQGGREAQAAAHDFLDELRPKWLLVIGIAGGRPSTEFAPGDVVISSRVYDFSVEAVLKDGERQYNLGGGPLHPQAANAAANLTASMGNSDWNSPKMIPPKRPSLVITKDRLEGPENWRRMVKESLSNQVGRKRPQAIAGPIASSDRLLRNAEVFGVWLKVARQVYAVDMESAGIYRAAYARQVPFLAIRGISDIIGLKRDDPRWTTYACCSAAAFAYDFVSTLPMPSGVEEEAAGSVHWVLVLDGEYDQSSKATVEAVVLHLGKLLQGAHVTIERVERGSIAVYLRASRKSFQTVKNLFERGELNEILGLKVLSVREHTGWTENVIPDRDRYSTTNVTQNADRQHVESVRVDTNHARSTSEVIDRAIAENRIGERLLYFSAFIFITTGLAILIWAIRSQQPLMGLLGVLTSSLFWPALSSIRRTRKENLSIRLLEAALSRADTAKDAADALSQFFKDSMKVHSDGEPVKPTSPDIDH